MKPIYDESLYCQECGTEITVPEDKFNGHVCNDCAEKLDIAYLQATGQMHKYVHSPECCCNYCDPAEQKPIYNRAYVDRLFRDGMNDY